MKILTFGTCRVLMLFENIVNDTFLESLHFVNYGSFGGKNIIALTHDIFQVYFILNLIKNKNIIEYHPNLLSNFSVYLSKIGDYRENYMSVFKNYNIDESILNISDQLQDIEYIILEVCTLKKLIIQNVPMFLDINNDKSFEKITDDEFNVNFANLVSLIKSINENIKIIFVSHFISYNNEIIPERLHILNLLNQNSKKYDNCYVFCPSDHIVDNDLEDNRHYKPTSRHKILHALSNNILDIESQLIVNKLNFTGILKFNLLNYLNNAERQSFNTLNNVLNAMILKLKNNEIVNKSFLQNDYMYVVNNYLNESYNLSNPIFIDFFKITLTDLLTKIAEKYLKNDVFIYNPLMAVNYNCGDNRVQSQRWHRDPGGRKLIKFFIFFDKTNEINGSLEYIPNTQYTSQSKISSVFDFCNTLSIYPHNYIHNEQDYEKFISLCNNNQLITNCNNGECMSVDTTGFHRAGFCQKNNYRKYLHVLFLTKDYIINNQDKCDLYQNGFNYNKICNVDIKKVNEYIGKNKEIYFYK